MSGKGGAAPGDAHSGSPTTDGGTRRRTVGTHMLHSPIHPLITRASKYTPLSWDDVSELSGGGVKTPKEKPPDGFHHTGEQEHLEQVSRHGECVGGKDLIQDNGDQRGHIDPGRFTGERSALTDTKGNSVPPKSAPAEKFKCRGGGSGRDTGVEGPSARVSVIRGSL